MVLRKTFFTLKNFTNKITKLSLQKNFKSVILPLWIMVRNYSY